MGPMRPQEEVAPPTPPKTKPPSIRDDKDHSSVAEDSSNDVSLDSSVDDLPSKSSIRSPIPKKKRGSRIKKTKGNETSVVPKEDPMSTSKTRFSAPVKQRSKTLVRG